MVVTARSNIVEDASRQLRDDESELALLARTDNLAFEILYDRYLPSVYAYCYRRLGTRELAEDATAIVFTKAFGAIHRYRDRGPGFRAWLFAIAHNAVVDELRSRKWTTRFDRDEQWESVAVNPGPEESAIITADLARLRQLLGLLPLEAAQMIELRLAGLTDREIAHVLRSTNGAVRVSIHRSLKRLRTLMNPEGSRDE